ncbi:MAG: sulfite oxidase-like oxidoreductase [Blastocatellia bacterium]|nr:sulfite oxidase-like oxidoreductase [Blastocatellia bacterium]
MERIKSLLGFNNQHEENREPIDESVIISSDTLRENRIPPGQVKTVKWPVLHVGNVPKFDREKWSFCLHGMVEKEWCCNYDQFLELPKVRVLSDFHCVTTWSKLDNLWEGVSTQTLFEKVNVNPKVKYVLVYAEHGWTTNMPLEDFLQKDSIFAYNHNGKPLSPDHGYPLRLVIPKLYAWKSAKWVRSVEFLETDRAGFWEEGGYHMVGDPWKEQRFRWNG